MAPGRFITLEGGEGGGKSTQRDRLATRLEAAGFPVVATREPGGAPGSEAIRTLLVDGEPGRWDPLTETLLHMAARREHVVRTIAPALAAGHWVVSDRFLDSTMAYQGLGQGVGRETIERLSALALGELKPDLTLILDLPPETGLARAAARRDGEDRYERMDLAFHERLRDAFREIAALEPGRCRVIDATREVDAVERAIWSAVAEAFGLA
jgi:dTMP kinase